jgi:hypothetical protein
MVIHERCSAGSTEEFRLERLGQGKAGGADWYSRDIGQRLLAEPAIIWKNQVENERRKAIKDCNPQAL